MAMKVKQYKCRNCKCNIEPFFEDVKYTQDLCNVSKYKCDIKKINLNNLPHREAKKEEPEHGPLCPCNFCQDVRAIDARPQLPKKEADWEPLADLHTPLQVNGVWTPCDCGPCFAAIRQRLNLGFKWSIKGGKIEFEKDDVTSPLQGTAGFGSIKFEHGNLCNCRECEYERQLFTDTDEVSTAVIELDEDFEREYPNPIEVLIDKKGSRTQVNRNQ